MRTNGLTRHAGLAALALAGALGGCVAYSPSPGMTKDPSQRPDPVYAVQEICAAAAKHVVEVYPINEPYAVNLPAGLTKRDCERVVRLMKDENAHVLTTTTQSMPIVHVEAVSVIGDGATVRVFRPVGLSAVQAAKGAAGTPGGPTSLTQVMEVQVRGGLAPWHAVAMRGLMLGAVATPAMNIVPEDNSMATPAQEPETEPAQASETPEN